MTNPPLVIGKGPPRGGPARGRRRPTRQRGRAALRFPRAAAPTTAACWTPPRPASAAQTRRQPRSASRPRNPGCRCGDPARRLAGTFKQRRHKEFVLPGCQRNHGITVIKRCRRLLHSRGRARLATLVRVAQTKGRHVMRSTKQVALVALSATTTMGLAAFLTAGAASAALLTGAVTAATGEKMGGVTVSAKAAGSTIRTSLWARVPLITGQSVPHPHRGSQRGQRPEGEEIVRAGRKLPGKANPLVPGSNPGRPTNPQGSVASSSSSCANVSCVASAAPVPAASSASFDG